MRDSALFRLLRKHFSRRELLAFRDGLEALTPESYDAVIEQALRAAPRLEAQFARNEGRVDKLYAEDRETPLGRLQLLMDNSPPPLLLVLARRCFRESYGERLDRQRRSLELAQAGLRAVLLIRKTDYLSEEMQADLEAEARLYVGNAFRLNSDMRGAEGAFRTAKSLLAQGTGDRGLKADFFHFLAHLKFRQARIDEAARLFDREISLRRLLANPEALGTALIARGTTAAWQESLEKACAFLSEGAVLVEDEDVLLMTLNPIAERLARDGRGFLSFKVICAAETLALFAGSTTHQLRLRWVKGIAYRAAGELSSAARELREVRQQLISDGLAFRSALATLDLTAVLAAQGKIEEVKELAQEAYTIFEAEGLGKRALAALIVFQKAALAEELTEALAVQVANFIAAYEYNRNLHFEPESEG